LLSEDVYFSTLNEAEIWQRYCGFLDLTIDEFLKIQNKLLLDQIERVADSILGKKIMNGEKPKTVDEFREIVPLTLYEDYEPYLSERQEDALAVKPLLWCHSSGRGGRFKWVPHSPEFIEKVTRVSLGSLILATARKKGEVNIAPGFRILLSLPAAPYTSGAQFQAVAKHLSFRPIPSLEESQGMEFQESIKKGFAIAFKEGVDVIGAIASVLVSMGELFSEQTQGMKFSMVMLKPKILGRLVRAWIKSKREKRPILPKDLWPAKAVMAGGIDASIYKEDIKRYWGCEPYQPYGMTEAFLVAMPAWTKEGMFFPPDIVFFEFIPYDDILKHQNDDRYQPPTVLLSELQPGKIYEVVISHFYGMPLLRYRTQDLIKVIDTKDDKTGIKLPQIMFYRRIADVINLAALAQLDERTIWQAINNTGIKFVEWAACKEYDQNKTYLRLYIELKEEKGADELAARIDEQFKIIDVDYKDLETYLNLKPVRVTLLSHGTFSRYMEEKRKQGADLAWLKPAHINPTDEAIKHLLELSEIRN
jgi:hypothetical protein